MNSVIQKIPKIRKSHISKKQGTECKVYEIIKAIFFTKKIIDLLKMHFFSSAVCHIEDRSNKIIPHYPRIAYNKELFI